MGLRTMELVDFMVKDFCPVFAPSAPSALGGFLRNASGPWLPATVATQSNHGESADVRAEDNVCSSLHSVWGCSILNSTLLLARSTPRDSLEPNPRDSLECPTLQCLILECPISETLECPTRRLPGVPNPRDWSAQPQSVPGVPNPSCKHILTKRI